MLTPKKLATVKTRAPVLSNRDWLTSLALMRRNQKKLRPRKVTFLKRNYYEIWEIIFCKRH